MTKKITIISGKGGTGKTTLAAAIASLTEGQAVFADADVDAPDLHLLLQPKILKKEELYISKKAKRDEDKCTRCNLCGEMCRFDAITATTFDYYKCEGCGLCVRICPEDALSMEAVRSAKAMTTETRFGPFFYAEMGIGEGNSGRIVDKVRKLAEAKAEEAQLPYLIIDGPPGIGCPVIASITGVDGVVIIIEPTLSGIHDLERVLGITAHFGIQAMVCINKYDLNEANTKAIKDFCEEEGIAVVGVIPFDPIAPKSIVEQKTIFEMPENAIAEAITKIWRNIKKELKH